MSRSKVVRLACSACSDPIERDQLLCLRCTLVAWVQLSSPDLPSRMPVHRTDCGNCGYEIPDPTPIRGYCRPCIELPEIQQAAQSVPGAVYHAVKRISDRPEFRDRLLFDRPLGSIANGSAHACGHCLTVPQWMFACVACRRIVCESCFSPTHGRCLCRREHLHLCGECSKEYACRCLQRQRDRTCPRCVGSNPRG